MILFFGRIAEYKGIEYLIKAAPLIQKEYPDATIVIAGKRDSRYHYKTIISDNIIIKDYRISNSEVDELFQKCSFVVLPYIDASQSGVISTAYAYRKPVIVTDVGSLSQYVIQNQTGYIIPPRDSLSIAKSSLKLLKNKNKQKKMSKAITRLSNSIVSWPVIAKKTINSYNRTLKLFE